MESGISVLQSEHQHNEAIDQNMALFHEQMDQAEKLHATGMLQKVGHYKQEVVLSCELFDAQRALAVDIARREAIRDLWDQKNEVIQTMLVVSTLMWSCNFNMIVDGIFPKRKETISSIIVYALGTAIAQLVLLISIILLLLMYSRLARYDLHKPLKRYRCGHLHKDFNSYYDCHCAHLARRAMQFFYIGSCATLVGCNSLFLSKYLFIYDDKVSSAFFAILCSSGILFSLMGEWVLGSSELMEEKEKIKKKEKITGDRPLQYHEHDEGGKGENEDEALSPTFGQSDVV